MPHGPPEHSRPQKNYHDSDDTLKQLHDDLHREDGKQERKDIRAKIRERLEYLRANDPDLPDREKSHKVPPPGRSRGSDKLPKSTQAHHEIGSEKSKRPYAVRVVLPCCCRVVFGLGRGVAVVFAVTIARGGPLTHMLPRWFDLTGHSRGPHQGSRQQRAREDPSAAPGPSGEPAAWQLVRTSHGDDE
jgi:hypothetical protein